MVTQGRAYEWTKASGGKEPSEENIKLSCKGIQKEGNNINYQKFKDVLFNGVKDKVLNIENGKGNISVSVY